MVSQPRFEIITEPTLHLHYRRTQTLVPYRQTTYNCALQANDSHVCFAECTRNGPSVPSVLGRSLTESLSVPAVPCARVRRSTLANGRGGRSTLTKSPAPTTGRKRTFLSKRSLYRFCEAVNFVRARSSASQSLRSVARLFRTGVRGSSRWVPASCGTVSGRISPDGGLTPGRTESPPSTGGSAYCTRRSAAARSRPNRAGAPPRSIGDVSSA